jgi:hypothetical protein
VTCIACGRTFSWSSVKSIGPHIHLVLEADIYGEHPPCGFALGADVEGVAPTFICLEHGRVIGFAAGLVVDTHGRRA